MIFPLSLALRYQAAFYPTLAKAQRTVVKAWHRWGRLLLGWESSIPGPAVLGDLGWRQWQFEAADARICLLAPASGVLPTRQHKSAYKSCYKRQV